MMTLKALTKNGSEQVFEVKNFGYNAEKKWINAVDCDGDAFTIYINDDPIVVVYVMNSKGSTIAKYSPGIQY